LKKDKQMKWSQVNALSEQKAYHIDVDIPQTFGNKALLQASFKARFDKRGELETDILDVLIGLSMDKKTLFLEISPDQTFESLKLMDAASMTPFSLVFLPDNAGHFPKELWEKVAKAYFSADYFAGVVFPFTTVLSLFFKQTLNLDLGQDLNDSNLPFLKEPFESFYGKMPLEAEPTQNLIQNVRQGCIEAFGSEKEFTQFLKDTLKEVQK